jgi:hypothetical protein
VKPFPYIKLAVHFNGLDREIFHYFLGSFIRGNFGMYLKKTVCPFHLRKPCQDCLIHKKCFYVEIFETQRDFDKVGRNIPLPFVIDLEEMENGPEAVNRDIKFQILLYGPALHNVEFFILVFSEMGKNGIGKQRIRCRQMVVEDHDGSLIYSSARERLLKSPQPLNFQLEAGNAVSRLGVAYLSTVRLKREGQLVLSPDFETLIRAALRRLVFLESFYGTPAALPTQEIVKTSAMVRAVASDVHWVDRYRYSNRHRYRMNLGGLLGRQEFAGDISSLHLDLLRFASIFHLGKSSTFGHGKIALESSRDSQVKENRVIGV